MPKLTATLPGDMVLQARSTMSGDASRPTVSGEFSLVGPKLRETLAWLDVDVSSIPAAKLTRLSLKGKMASTGGNVAVSDAVFELDDLKGSGGIAVTFGVPLHDRDQPGDRHGRSRFLHRASRPRGQKPAGRCRRRPVRLRRPAGRGRSDDRAKGQGRPADLQKETIGGIDVDVALQGSTLRLNDVKVSNLLGARLAVRGTVAGYDAVQPHPDIAFNFEAPDMTRRAEVRGRHGAGRARRRERERRRGRQPRAAHPPRVRRQRHGPQLQGERHAVAAGHFQGRAAVGRLQGQRAC